MKKFVIIGSIIAALIVAIAALAFFFGNDEGKIENLLNKTVASLDNSGKGLKNLFLDDAKKYSLNLDDNIKEAAEFYKGKSTSIEELYIYHEKDNIFTLHAKVNTDKDSYFICLSASGARFVDKSGINQIILEKYNTFSHKKVVQKKKLNDYKKQARTYGITVRTPGDHDTHLQENKMIEKMLKRDHKK